MLERSRLEGRTIAAALCLFWAAVWGGQAAGTFAEAGAVEPPCWSGESWPTGLFNALTAFDWKRPGLGPGGALTGLVQLALAGPFLVAGAGYLTSHRDGEEGMAVAAWQAGLLLTIVALSAATGWWLMVAPIQSPLMLLVLVIAAACSFVAAAVERMAWPLPFRRMTVIAPESEPIAWDAIYWRYGSRG